MNDRQHPKERSYPAQWLFLGAALLSLGGVIGWNLYAEHDTLDAGERERLGHQAKVIDEHLGQQLLAVNLALDSLRGDLPILRALGKAQLNLRLKNMGDAMPGVRTLVINDADGTLIASNREELIGRNSGELEYFRIARQSRNPAMLHVAPPFRTVLGAFALNLVKVIPDARGEFAGVIAATLDPEYFSALLDSVRYAPDMWAFLAHSDGKLFLMRPARPGLEGIDLARPGTFYSRHRDSGQKSNVMTGIAQTTGEERLVAMHTIQPANLAVDKTLVVAVARNLPSIFVRWRENAFVQGGLFALLVLATSLGLAFYQKRQRHADRLAAVYEAEQRRQIEQYRSIVHASLDGFWITDSRGRIVDANQSICGMLGYSREELLRMSLQDIEADQSPARIAARIRQMIESGAVQFEARHRRKDGKLIDVEVSVQYVAALGEQFFAFVRDVTERKRIEDALRRSETLLSQSQKIAKLGGWDYAVDSGRILWTGEVYSIYEVDPGFDPNDIARDIAFYAPEHQALIARAFERAVSEGEPYNLELQFTGAKGTRKWVRTAAQAEIIDGKVRRVIGDIQDVTERKLLERQREQYFRFFQLSIDPMCIADPFGCFTQVNPAFMRLTGFDESELVAKSFLEFILPEDRQRTADEMKQQVEVRPSLCFENRYVCKDGRVVLLSWNAYFDRNDGVTYATARDVTEREKVTAELKRSNAELEQFSYAISHDMRQPLRMISSYMQLIEAGLADQLDAEKREFFGYAIDGAKRLDAMLLGLLEYSRVGRKGAPPEWIDSRAVLDEALLFLRPEVAAVQARLSVAGDWPRIFACRDEMLRLMLNLIGNALKFRVAGRTPEVVVTSETVANEWRMSVADNGVGILPDQIGRLFHVFQRLQSRADYEGTGIGLALCRKIAERHGGRIRVESPGRDQGSTLMLSLPALQET